MNSGKIIIGHFTLDLADCRLSDSQGNHFHLPNKSTRVLWALATRTSELVTREQLVDSIWDGNYIIGPTRLNDEIWKIRKTLREAGAEGLKIKTIPRKGYCLLVDEVTTADTEADTGGWLSRFPIPAQVRTALASFVTVALLGSSMMIRNTEQLTDVAGTPGTGSVVITSDETDLVQFVVDLLDFSDSPASPAQDEVLSEILHKAEQQLPQFSRDPVVRAQMLAGLGEIHYGLGEFEKALDLLCESNEIDQQIYGEDSYEYLNSQLRLAKVYRATGRVYSARQVYQTALFDIGRFDNTQDELSQIYNGLGILDWRSGNYLLSEQNFLAALEQSDANSDEPDELLAESLDNLGFLYHHSNRLEEALALYQQAHEIRTKLFGNTRRAAIGRSLNNQADLLMQLGRIEQARELGLSSVAAFEEFHGEEYFGTGAAHITLSKILLASDDIETAEHHLLEGIRILKLQDMNQAMYQMARATQILGDLQDRLGVKEKAQQYYRLNIAGLQKIFGEEHPETLAARGRLEQYVALN